MLPVGQANGESQLAGLVVLQAKGGVSGELNNRVRISLGDLFNLDATFSGGDHHHALRSPVENRAEVDLFFVGNGLGDEYLLDDKTFNVHPKDLTCHLFGLFRRSGELHAASLPAPAHKDLGLHDDGPT